MIKELEIFMFVSTFNVILQGVIPVILLDRKIDPSRPSAHNVELQGLGECLKC